MSICIHYIHRHALLVHFPTHLLILGILHVPFTIPQKARVPIAHHKFLLNPKEQAEMELPINPVNNTGLLPCRSENLPHNMAVQN